MKENRNLTVDDGVRTLIHLCLLDILSCREILEGKNIDDNIILLNMNDELMDRIKFNLGDELYTSNFFPTYNNYLDSEISILSSVYEYLERSGKNEE